jgi:hypothetical protein
MLASASGESRLDARHYAHKNAGSTDVGQSVAQDIILDWVPL